MNRTKVWIFFQDYGAVLALLVALTATLGSLYYSEVAGFVPCTLCWYQRILMYPLTLITLVGILRQDESLPSYVLPFSVTGMGVSGYHYLIQNGVFGHPATCTVGVPCSLRYVNYLGFITIPFMALVAFTLITAVMLATRRALGAADAWGEVDGPEEERETAGSAAAPSLKWAGAGAALLLLLLLALAAFRGAASAPAESAAPASIQAASISGEELFNRMILNSVPGCVVCHSLEPDVVRGGPSLAGIGRQAGARVSGRTAADYLRQSIVDPDVHLVDGYVAGTMYQGYGDVLSGAEIDALVAYMLTLD